MERFIADLHIHSRHSRATSKRLNVALLNAWSRIKGIDVLGTGDFTHSGWRQELRDALVLDEASGLYVMKDGADPEREVEELSGFSLPGRTHFMLQAEISSIYKRGGKVRKVHNLVFMPTLEAADAFSARLAKVGNLESDGRPILGLDSRDLLEMVLETDPLAFLVPAHIWTPWFSLFGSKSGFDAIEECFGDLSSEIFAMETGLSSDPEMNWMLSSLDRFRLVSNSDAHSGEKLAREANLFSGEMSYEGIFRALRGEALGHKFLGTLEFYPEEGKYHLDGHRKCNVMMEPRETIARGGVCPVCGKKLTVGVLHRVLSLADRDAPVQPPNQPGFESLVPLPEVLSEVLGKGPNTKTVRSKYFELIKQFGSELAILQDVPPEDIARISTPLAVGLTRMRNNEVIREPGFDGQFGVIRVFSPGERKELKRSGVLGAMAGLLPTEEKASAREKDSATGPKDTTGTSALEIPLVDGIVEEEDQAPRLNESQQKAAAEGPGPVLVLAGPGTGKTHTLLGRVADLLEKGENPRRVLAVTFTRKAARELEERLVRQFGENTTLPRADTLHALAFEYWRDAYNEAPVVLDEEAARKVFYEANGGLTKDNRSEMDKAWQSVSLARERMDDLGSEHYGPELKEQYHRYVKLKESWNLADYTDLLEFWLEQIEAKIYVCRYTKILVDEVQDLSRLQLTLIRALVPEMGQGGEGFFAIGDPLQSIYGFRGAQGDIRGTLESFWPHLKLVALEDNYRSAQNILDLAATLYPDSPALTAQTRAKGIIRLFEAPSAQSEASWVADRIRHMLGGTSHSLADYEDEGMDDSLQGALSPGDIAVLVRFKGLMPILKATLERLGLPCSVPEQEAFWVEPRVAMILEAAGKFLGISWSPSGEDGDRDKVLGCPDKVLAKGPMGLSAYFQDMPPFDAMFWKSRAFRQLTAAYQEQNGWVGLLNWVHLQSAMEMVSRRSEKVQVMTLHAAKGLEFRAVFLPCLEDGILPFAGADFLTGKSAAQGKGGLFDVEEEKRLLYVGLTRAREGLFLSRAATRKMYGQELNLPPSRFLKTLLSYEGIKQTTLKARKAHKEEQLRLM